MPDHGKKKKYFTKFSFTELWYYGISIKFVAISGNLF
jgi:hypothetical protein